MEAALDNGGDRTRHCTECWLRCRSASIGELIARLHYSIAIMIASDVAKEVVRIASTHGLAKDVIDLMEKKLVLVTQEIADLTRKNAVLVSRVSALEADKVNLESQIQKIRPESLALDQQSKAILKFFFDRADNISGRDVVRQFRLQTSVSDYHIDILMAKEFITQTRLGGDSASCWFTITGMGREFMIKNPA
jgi:hypothetical protein